jgi:hypothetical protein
MWIAEEIAVLLAKQRLKEAISSREDRRSAGSLRPFRPATCVPLAAIPMRLGRRLADEPPPERIAGLPR